MASRQLARVAVQSTKIPQRAICTSSAKNSHDIVLDQKTRDRIYPKLGNRDIVGFGMNGRASYIDSTDFPCPAIRFRENTPDILALREKEKAEWKNLTLEEKRDLYRASFCQTFAEMKAPKGEWKGITASVLFALCLSGALLLWMKLAVYPELPRTITREWQEKELRRMVDLGSGAVTGISSKWDYEKGQWKN